MTWKRALKLILLALLIAALIIVALFIYRTVINPKAAFSTGGGPVSTGEPSDEQSALPTVSRQQFATERVNILVLGMDSNEARLESVREDFRTDTMLLVSIDFDTKKVDMITVPRDSYVTVTRATGSLYKVNSAAYFGGGMCDSGFLNACDTISGVFGGIPVDYYAAVNMDGLRALVDAIGGVYYDVDVDTTLDGIKLEEGYQLLNGQEALTYCRVRKGIGTDIDRQKRQQQMLVAIFKQLKENGEIGEIPEIYRSLEDMVYTNLSFEQICALAVFFEGFDDLDDIGRHVLEGEYHWAYDVYYYLLDQQAKADLVREIFGVDIGIDMEHDINYVLEDSPPHNPSHNEDEPEDEEPAEDTQEPAEPTPSADETSTPTEGPTSTPSEPSAPEATPQPPASMEPSTATS